MVVLDCFLLNNLLKPDGNSVYLYLSITRLCLLKGKPFFKHRATPLFETLVCVQELM